MEWREEEKERVVWYNNFYNSFFLITRLSFLFVKGNFTSVVLRLTMSFSCTSTFLWSEKWKVGCPGKILFSPSLPVQCVGRCGLAWRTDEDEELYGTSMWTPQTTHFLIFSFVGPVGSRCRFFIGESGGMGVGLSSDYFLCFWVSLVTIFWNDCS